MNMEQMTTLSLIIVGIAGLGAATAYVVVGPKLRKALHKAEKVTKRSA